MDHNGVQSVRRRWKIESPLRWRLRRELMRNGGIICTLLCLSSCGCGDSGRTEAPPPPVDSGDVEEAEPLDAGGLDVDMVPDAENDNDAFDLDASLDIPDDAAAGTECLPGQVNALEGGCFFPEPNCSGGWCQIPAGRFVMGSDRIVPGGYSSWQPAHTVEIKKAYAIQQTETTLEQWHSATGESFHEEYVQHCGWDCPASGVSLYGMLAFANAWSEQEGFLPCYVLEGCAGETTSSPQSSAPRVAIHVAQSTVCA